MRKQQRNCWADARLRIAALRTYQQISKKTHEQLEQEMFRQCELLNVFYTHASWKRLRTKCSKWIREYHAWSANRNQVENVLQHPSLKTGIRHCTQADAREYLRTLEATVPVMNKRTCKTAANTKQLRSAEKTEMASAKTKLLGEVTGEVVDTPAAGPCDLALDALRRECTVLEQQFRDFTRRFGNAGADVDAMLQDARVRPQELEGLQRIHELHVQMRRLTLPAAAALSPECISVKVSQSACSDVQCSDQSDRVQQNDPGRCRVAKVA